MGFVLILVKTKPIAPAFQDLRVLIKGNGVQAVKGNSLQKVAKAKTEVSHIPWNQYPIVNGNLIILFPFCHYQLKMNAEQRVWWTVTVKPLCTKTDEPNAKASFEIWKNSTY